MYRIIAILLCVFHLTVEHAQNYVVSGNKYICVVNDSIVHKAAPIETPCIYVDKDKVEHVIWLSSNGHAYIIKVSKKTNKEYRQYLGEKMSREICKKMKVKYVDITRP